MRGDALLLLGRGRRHLYTVYCYSVGRSSFISVDRGEDGAPRSPMVREEKWDYSGGKIVRDFEVGRGADMWRKEGART